PCVARLGIPIARLRAMTVSSVREPTGESPMNGSSDALDQPISVPRSPCYGLALLRRRRSQPLASVFARFVILLGCVGTFAALLAGCAPKFAPIPGAASQFDRDHFECEAIAHGMTEGSRQAM